MGISCSKTCYAADSDYSHGGRPPKHCSRQESPDPAVYDLTVKSLAYTQRPAAAAASETTASGQHHLLYKQQKGPTSHHFHASTAISSSTAIPLPTGVVSVKKDYSTRTVVRRHSPRHSEEGMSGTHIYCIRYPNSIYLDSKGREVSIQQEQCPVQTPLSSQVETVSTEQSSGMSSAGHAVTVAAPNRTWTAPPSSTPNSSSSKHKKKSTTAVQPSAVQTIAIARAAIDQHASIPPVPVDQMFRPAAMAVTPAHPVVDWTTISSEHHIYVADVGLTVAQCDEIVAVTEQVCRGQYAAYTYAKQTLGCREFPVLAATCLPAAHTVTHAITEFCQNTDLSLDDREPHMVKYDVTKKERQKLNMHTDKSEWTFLIALSNACGMDYEGGGTYFECLDATVHLQRGHALVFPGKLRHCGQRITAGLRFLLVGFLVDKSRKLSCSSTGDGEDASNGAVAFSNYQ